MTIFKSKYKLPPSGYIFIKSVYKQNSPAQAPVFHVFIDKEAHVGKWTCCSKTGSQKAGWWLGWQRLCKLKKMGNKMLFIVCYVSFNYEVSANAWQALKTKHSNKVSDLTESWQQHLQHPLEEQEKRLLGELLSKGFQGSLVVSLDVLWRTHQRNEWCRWRHWKGIVLCRLREWSSSHHRIMDQEPFFFLPLLILLTAVNGLTPETNPDPHRQSLISRTGERIGKVKAGNSCVEKRTA